MEELERKNAAEAYSSQKHPILIILDDIRSMHNVGSAFRTADGLSAAAIYLCGYTPAPPHREIHKTALGATETVQWQHFTDAKEAVLQAHALGYKVYATEQTHNSTPLHQFTWNGEPLALVFGNEVTGVNETVLAMVDGVLEIPQSGAKHSLNISVSLGIVLWELVRTNI